MQAVYQTLMKNNPAVSYKNHEDAERKLEEDTNVFAYALPVLFRNNKALAAVADFEDKTRNVNALGLVKDSELLQCFNHHIATMMESGIIHFLLDKYGLLEYTGARDEDRATVVALGYGNLMMPMFVMGMGCCMAVVVVATEIFYRREIPKRES